MNDNLAADLASLRIDRAPKPPRQGVRTALGVLLFTGAAAAAVTYGKPYLERRIFKTEVAVTEIGSVSPIQAEVDLTATGYVIPQLTAKVAAKIVGRVSKVAIVEGGTVKAGDLLFELDPDDQNAAIAAAKARAAAAQARVATARANAAQVDIDYRRNQKLAQEGAAQQAEVDDDKAKLDALTAAIVAAEAETRSAQAEVASLSTGAKNLRIMAPIEGTALGKPASVGDVASPGQVLVELANFASLLVEVDVPEGRLHQVRLHAPCEIVLDAYPQDRFPGQVVEIGPRLDRAKATALVKVKFDKPPDALRPEMSARVSFLQKALDEKKLKEPEKVIVPAAAVVDRGGNKAVWVVKDGAISLVPVVLGEEQSGGFVEKQGPPPGTKIVAHPADTLANGMPVKDKSGS